LSLIRCIWKKRA